MNLNLYKLNEKGAEEIQKMVQLYDTMKWRAEINTKTTFIFLQKI